MFLEFGIRLDAVEVEYDDLKNDEEIEDEDEDEDIIENIAEESIAEWSFVIVVGIPLRDYPNSRNLDFQFFRQNLESPDLWTWKFISKRICQVHDQKLSYKWLLQKPTKILITLVLYRINGSKIIPFRFHAIRKTLRESFSTLYQWAK
jgi:hypothetical protein